MARRLLTISILPEIFAICRLEKDARVPQWAAGGNLTCITRTTDELSVVCPESVVPENVQAQRGWRALKVHGPFDFSETGVLAALAAPLAEAGISIFAVSSYDTDYVLVEERNLEAAARVLATMGHHILRKDRALR
jgi:hypothetical protein